MTQHINATPTWAGLLPALLAVVENGTFEGQTMARAELARMAKAADQAVSLSKAAEAAAKVPTFWVCKGAVTDTEAHRPSHRFIVDGFEHDDPDAMQSCDGCFAPFRIFEPDSQSYIPGEYQTRIEAQEIADFLNGNRLGATEWQISDGPSGERSMSADYLDLETALRAHAPAIFHFEG